MKMYKILIAAAVLLLTRALHAQPTIDATNWPYGSDQIGNFWDYHNTGSTYAVNMSAINPLQMGGSWDFTAGPTDGSASSEIREVAAAPAPAPSSTSFVEYQTVSGSTQWFYGDESAAGTWGRGFSQGGTIYPYDPPQWNVYHYPMTIGTMWTSSWTWGEEAFGAPMQETRSSEIVGWGTVTVPFGSSLTCLVMRTLQTSYLEFMGVPIVNDSYRVYEWLVPGLGSVVAIQSVNGESNWLFNSAAGYYRLFDSNLGGDLIPPTISSVTDWNDTPNRGPYTVNATITDESGLSSVAIFYSIAGGAFQSAPFISLNGDEYSFEIPSPGGAPIQEIRYYIRAVDASLNANSAHDPANAPIGYYSFNWINDNLAPVFTNVTTWTTSNYSGPFHVLATINDDNEILFASLHYKFGGGAWEEAIADGSAANLYHFTIPVVRSSLIVRYYLEAVDNSGFFNTGFHPAAGQAGPIVFQANLTAGGQPADIDDLTLYTAGGEATLRWGAVTQSVNGNPVTIRHYDIFHGQAGDESDLMFMDVTTANSYVDSLNVPTTSQGLYRVVPAR